MKHYYEEKDYSALEVCLSCVSFSRIIKRHAGDIILVRPILGRIGWKEAKDYFWLPVEGIDKTMYAYFQEPLILDEEPYDKRRYSIPFNRLETLCPFIDFERIADDNDVYQPFYQLDIDTYEFILCNEVLQFEGLIFDKNTGLYL